MKEGNWLDRGTLIYSFVRFIKLILTVSCHYDTQEWEMRSSYHKSLVSMFTREYQHLPEIRILSSNFEERNRCKCVSSHTAHDL